MDRLYYFSKSADKPPGKGVNEYVTDPSRYQILRAISNWRQKLSNFWVNPFDVQGVRWNSMEHMFQSYKLSLANPVVAWSFTLNSGSDLGKSSGDEAQRHRKDVILTPDQLAQWEELRDTVLYNGLTAKFNQDPELKRLLLATGTAELWHGTPRVPAQRQLVLERVRSELIN